MNGSMVSVRGCPYYCSVIQMIDFPKIMTEELQGKLMTALVC